MKSTVTLAAALISALCFLGVFAAVNTYRQAKSKPRTGTNAEIIQAAITSSEVFESRNVANAPAVQPRIPIPGNRPERNPAASQEPFGSLTIFPDALKSPEKMAAIARYREITGKEMALLASPPPPIFNPPAWKSAAPDYEPTDEEVAAFDEAAAQHRAELRKWGAQKRERKSHRGDALANLSKAQKQLIWELGEAGYATFQQWEMAEKLARLLGSEAAAASGADLSPGKVRDGAMYLAYLWAEGKEFSTVRQEIVERIGALDPSVEVALARQMKR